MTFNTPWTDRALCRELSYEEADRIFFPTSGGKPTEARAFCAQCPVVKECLLETMELNLQGFQAGTTPKERRVMAKVWHIQIEPLENVLPPEPVTRKVYRKIQQPNLDTLAFLDTLTEPILFT